MIVDARYHLPLEVREKLRQQPVAWGFGPLSEAVYYRTYSRTGDDGQEAWADTICRVVDGVMSIRKDWITNVLGKRWSDKHNDPLATELAEAMFEMKLLPPGRGLWAMGTDYVFERGSHALNNCGAVDVQDELARPARWLMDSLMCGVGVGFTTSNAMLRKFPGPHGEAQKFEVPDTKEGWAESVKRLIQSYERGTRPLEFDYTLIRGVGEPIRGFGGVSAGYYPLENLHVLLKGILDKRTKGEVSDTRLIADVMNAIGTCVVAGNVRRSAELAVGAAGDIEFMDLKDYEKNPERAALGWMSNNSVALSEREHFTQLPEIAERVRDIGEPGILNLLNVRKYGRLGEKMHDDAVAINPCGEIPLESRELCNLVEVFPTRCDPAELPRILELGTYYASTVALLRSHDADTNEVVARNRRIGVSVSGIADWLDSTSVSHVFDALNRGYDTVRATNRQLAKEAGVPESIRVTTVKPSGTVSLLAGVSSGVHFPIGGYVTRRMRVGTGSPVSSYLKRAGVPWEKDVVSADTNVFEFPLRYGSGRTRSVRSVSVFEQAAVVTMLQRCWADNAVSNTLTVQPDELKHVERVLALFAPQVKSMSLMPDRENVYAQMPVERSTKEDYESRLSKIKPIRWDRLHDSDGDASEEAYCQGDFCEIPQKQ
jgi:ribonucleoside-diphosphate reductase alpha chain